MFKKVKLGLSLIKYGFRPKTNLFMFVLFLAIGFAVEIASKGTQLIGGFYMLLTALFAYQMIISMDLATMVQTSKMKKALQTTVPAITSFVMYIVIFTLIAIERILLVKFGVSSEAELVGSTMSVVLVLFVALIYAGICYKFFIVSTILFAVAIVFLVGVLNFAVMAGIFDIGIGATIGIGYALIIAGALIQYLLSCIFYKTEMSKFAFKGILGRMQ